MLLTRDGDEADRLRRGIDAISPAISKLALAGSVAQVRKVGGLVWETGFDHLYRHPTSLLAAVRANDLAADALADGDAATVVSQWRYAHRECRAILDSMMVFALTREEMIPPDLRQYLVSPYALAHIPTLNRAPDPNGPWRFVREWDITGPFPLEVDNDPETMAPGFERVYPPEVNDDPAATFEGVDGPTRWRRIQADVDGGVDLLQHFDTTDDVVCYARCKVVVPEAMDVNLSLGSNDGAKIWVNGEVVFALHAGRRADPHMNTIPVRLNAGANDVLVKVENLGSRWQLYVSFDDPDRVLTYGTE